MVSRRKKATVEGQSNADQQQGLLDRAEEKKSGDDGRKFLALEAVSGPCKGAVHAGKTNRITIGRKRVNNFYIKDSTISERHAVIEWSNDSWTIVDLGSSNGTAVNRKPIEEGAIVTLDNEDEVQVGLETRLRVQIRPALDPRTTTRAWLEQECALLVRRLQLTMEKTAVSMRQEGHQVKDLLRETLDIKVGH